MPPRHRGERAHRRRHRPKTAACVECHHERSVSARETASPRDHQRVGAGQPPPELAAPTLSVARSESSAAATIRCATRSRCASAAKPHRQIPRARHGIRPAWSAIAARSVTARMRATAATRCAPTATAARARRRALPDATSRSGESRVVATGHAEASRGGTRRPGTPPRTAASATGRQPLPHVDKGDTNACHL